jgi:hypothetical protein
MATPELLWTIQEDRRRVAALAARERLARTSGTTAGAVGRLAGWVRGRIRVFRRPTPGQIGWTSAR